MFIAKSQLKSENSVGVACVFGLKDNFYSHLITF
jgi:hypothetical protein